MPSPLLFILASLIWGSTFWAITLQLGSVPPAVSVAYRFGLASLVLFVCCWLRGDRLRLPWPTQRWLALQGVATFSVAYVCTYLAEQYLVSAMVAVLYALMVFWNPIGARIAFGTPLTWRIWLAGAVSIAGVSLLFLRQIQASFSEAGAAAGFLPGLAFGLAATISSSVGNVLVVRARRESGNILLSTAWAMLWGSLLVAIWATLSGQQWVLPRSATYWLALLYLSVFGSVVAFTAYFVLLERIGAQKAVYIGVVTPVISMLLSIRLEQYRPGPLEWAGMALCMAGVAWALKDDAPVPPKPIFPTPNQKPS